MMIASLAIAIFGIWLARRMFIRQPSLAQAAADANPPIYRLLCGKYFVDETYDFLFVNPGKRLAWFLWRGVDAVVIDGGANGIGRIVRWASGVLRLLQTGYVKSYAVSMVIGAVLLVLYYVVRY